MAHILALRCNAQIIHLKQQHKTHQNIILPQNKDKGVFENDKDKCLKVQNGLKDTQSKLSLLLVQVDRV